MGAEGDGRLNGDGRPALHVCHVLAAGEYGGLESVVELLTQGQAEAGHRVSVVLILEPGKTPHAFESTLLAAGREVQTIRLGARAYRAQQQALREKLRALRPDVVHGHGYQADIHLAMAARAASVASVSTVHGFTGGGFKMRLYEALHLRALRRIDRVVAVSAPIVSRLEAAGVPESRIRLVRNAWAASTEGLDRAEARAALDLPDDGFVIGWVGRLSFEKGADQLVAALAHVADRRAHVCFVGDGPEEAALREQVAQRGLEARVHFSGARAGAGRFFKAFDVYALSSRTEGTPMVLFEAASAGVPIVATAVGGVPDVLSPEEAVLVESEDPLSLAHAIDGVVAGGRDVEQRAARATSRIADDFAIEPWLGAYDALYRELT